MSILLQEHFNCYTHDESVGPMVLSFKEETTSQNHTQIRAILRYRNMNCKFGNFSENLIFANRVKRHICGVKNCDYGMIYLSVNGRVLFSRNFTRAILQYFQPSLSYNLSLRSLFCLLLSSCFTQVLL